MENISLFVYRVQHSRHQATGFVRKWSTCARSAVSRPRASFTSSPRRCGSRCQVVPSTTASTPPRYLRMILPASCPSHRSFVSRKRELGQRRTHEYTCRSPRTHAAPSPTAPEAARCVTHLFLRLSSSSFSVSLFLSCSLASTDLVYIARS